MTASATSLPIASRSAYPDSPDVPYTATADAGDFFDTLLDIVNPLQHIPIVSNLYREVTGDTVSSMARMVGGAVFGGPVGFASATANILLEQASGGDFMDHAVAMVTGDNPEPPLHAAARTVGPTSQTAENTLPEADFGEIAWFGPRVLPSLARLENTASLQMVNKSTTGRKRRYYRGGYSAECEPGGRGCAQHRPARLHRPGCAETGLDGGCAAGRETSTGGTKQG